MRIKSTIARPLVSLICLLFICPFVSQLRAQVPHGYFANVRQILDVDAAYFDYGPVVSGDGLTLLFGNDDCQTGLVNGCDPRPGTVGGQDLWMATRTSLDELFSNAENLEQLNSLNHEGPGSLSADELTVYFSSARTGDGDLYQASRASLGEDFDNPIPLSELNTVAWESGGSVSADGLTIVFQKQFGQPPAGQLSIWMATRDSVDQPFSGAEPVFPVSFYSSAGPSLSPDGKTLFFMDGWTAPRRPGGSGTDIWVAFRASTDKDFGDAVNLNEQWPGSTINTSVTDGTPSVSPDWPLAGSKLYFTRATSNNAVGGVTIMEADWITDPGDLDASGQLDANDLDLLSLEIRTAENRRGFDLNSDQLVDEKDHEVWVKELKNTWFGDANLDGEFNTGDLVQVLGTGKYETQEYASWSEGDWNGDGVFGTGDLVKALEDGGYEMGPRMNALVVPEPSGAAVLAIGVFVALCRQRRIWAVVVRS